MADRVNLDELNLMTTTEVAEATRTSPATLRWWRHHGTGPRSVQIGRSVFYRREDVEDWLTEQFARR